MVARITFKEGVRLCNLQPQVALALQIAAGCYGLVNVDEMVVTSCNDSTHRRGSLHYSGNAVDLRTKSIKSTSVPVLLDHLKHALGVDFDVVLESFHMNDRKPNEHLHVEYQPKD